MAGENIDWGALRIHGELLKLGFAISERTVARYPTWSAEGRSVYGLYRQGNLIVGTDADSGPARGRTETRVPNRGQHRLVARWTADWEPIVVRDLSSTQIFQIDLDR